jgi:hypothetical protein
VGGDDLAFVAEAGKESARLGVLAGNRNARHEGCEVLELRPAKPRRLT